MAPQRGRVASRAHEMDGTVTLEVEPLDAPFAPYRPGQFNMLWAFGIGEVPISISGDPEGANTRLHTIRAVGPVTGALAGLQVGEVLGVRGPYGNGWNLGRDGGDVVMIAGGIGLAPIRPAMRAALAERSRLGRVILLAGARSPDALLYRDDLAAWRSRFDLEVEVIVDTAPSEWRGEVGLVTTLIDREPFEAASTTALVCGPEVMMRHAAAALEARGVRAGAIQLSIERNMKCAISQCGHCQLGPLFACREGPVLTWDRAEPLLRVREL